MGAADKVSITAYDQGTPPDIGGDIGVVAIRAAPHRARRRPFLRLLSRTRSSRSARPRASGTFWGIDSGPGGQPGQGRHGP